MDWWVRHPSDVTASLIARDVISPELSGLLWLKYNLLTERWSRPHLRVFVEYRNLLSDWRREVARVSEALAIDLSANEAEIDAFLDPALCHANGDRSATELFERPWMGEVYAALAAAARDGSLDFSLMDGAFAQYHGGGQVLQVAADEFIRRFGPAARAAECGQARLGCGGFQAVNDRS
jgi:hypothetical protein